MAIQIEKGVPLPAAATKYPFADMDVGDSFVVLLADSACSSIAFLQRSLGSSAKNALGPGKITTRKLPDGSGFRVWRIA